jgi:hypothetical protein
MKKFTKILFILLVISNHAYAETIEEKKARFVLLNMQHDYISCYVFYKIGTEYVKTTGGDSNIIEGIEKSSDTSLKLAHDVGEIIGLTAEEMSKKTKNEMKNQLNLIDNDFNNASILLEKYAKNCKNLIEDKKQRISFWEKKATEKFK